MIKESKKATQKYNATSKNTSFEVFMNTLSVGYHLAKIMEADPDFLKDKKNWERFELWCERHKIKKQ